MANPLSYLWLMFTQNDTIWYDGDVADSLGEDAKVQNSFLINPVIPMQLTDKWKLVLRPVIPVNSFETVDNVDITTDTPGRVAGVDFERENGIGDTSLTGWLSPTHSRNPACAEWEARVSRPGASGRWSRASRLTPST